MLLLNQQLLIICFIPRTGSNYLCDILSQAGIGTPLEYYYPYDFKERQRQSQKRFQIDKEQNPDELHWFMTVLQRQALKCTWPAYQQMIQETQPLFDKIEKKYIYLTRDDKLRQAISWYRAIETQRWSSRSPKCLTPKFNRQKITKILSWIKEQENDWSLHLKNIDHLHIRYESLNHEIIDTIEQFSGLKRHNNIITKSKYQILRDAITEEWVIRYNAKTHAN